MSETTESTALGSRIGLLDHAWRVHQEAPDSPLPHLNEAIARSDVDDDLVDHTGRLLTGMPDCGGIGMTLASYPPASIVLGRNAELLAGRLGLPRFPSSTVDDDE